MTTKALDMPVVAGTMVQHAMSRGALVTHNQSLHGNDIRAQQACGVEITTNHSSLLNNDASMTAILDSMALSTYGLQLEYVYVAFQNGEFVGARVGGSDATAITIGARDSSNNYCYSMYNSSSQQRVSSQELALGLSCDFDPLSRPWYLLASSLSRGGGTFTKPYVFESSHEVGITYTQPLFVRNGTRWEQVGALGVDLSFKHLRRALVRRIDPQYGSFFIVDYHGFLVAASRENSTSTNHLGEIQQQRAVESHDVIIGDTAKYIKSFGGADAMIERHIGMLEFLGEDGNGLSHEHIKLRRGKGKPITSISRYQEEALDWILVSVSSRELILSKLDKHTFISMSINCFTLMLILWVAMKGFKIFDFIVFHDRLAGTAKYIESIISVSSNKRLTNEGKKVLETYQHSIERVITQAAHSAVRRSWVSQARWWKGETQAIDAIFQKEMYYKRALQYIEMAKDDTDIMSIATLELEQIEFQKREGWRGWFYSYVLALYKFRKQTLWSKIILPLLVWIFVGLLLLEPVEYAAGQKASDDYPAVIAVEWAILSILVLDCGVDFNFWWYFVSLDRALQDQNKLRITQLSQEILMTGKIFILFVEAINLLCIGFLRRSLYGVHNALLPFIIFSRPWLPIFFSERLFRMLYIVIASLKKSAIMLFMLFFMLWFVAATGTVFFRKEFLVFRFVDESSTLDDHSMVSLSKRFKNFYVACMTTFVFLTTGKHVVFSFLLSSSSMSLYFFIIVVFVYLIHIMVSPILFVTLTPVIALINVCLLHFRIMLSQGKTIPRLFILPPTWVRCTVYISSPSSSSVSG